MGFQKYADGSLRYQIVTEVDISKIKDEIERRMDDLEQYVRASNELHTIACHRVKEMDPSADVKQLINDSDYREQYFDYYAEALLETSQQVMSKVLKQYGYSA